MTAQSDIANFRTDNNTNNMDLTDTDGLRYLNDGRDMLIDKIMTVKEDYFYNEITTDTVQAQREYTFPLRTSSQDGLVKIKGVSIKFKDTDTEFTKLQPKVLENLPYDLLEYDDSAVPFYVVSDNSVFIYPTPTEAVTAGLRIYGILYPKALALSDTDTKIPVQHQKSYLLYLGYKFYHSQRDFNTSQLMYNQFIVEINRISQSLSGRVQAPKVIGSNTNLNSLT